VSDRVRELLESLARELVDHPEAVRSEQRAGEGPDEVVIELLVADDDLGRVIGRGGRTVRALRTVGRAAAGREGQRLMLEVSGT
jgi:predicted RNA-binding protein YlqC (UPF0109 family)